MNDIVEKLRAAAAKDFAEDYTGACDLYLEAAAEIERLRTVLREARQWLATYCEEPAFDPLKAIIDAALSGKGET